MNPYNDVKTDQGVDGSFWGDGGGWVEDLHNLSVDSVVLDVSELKLFQLGPSFKKLLVELFKFIFFLLVGLGFLSYFFL